MQPCVLLPPCFSHLTTWLSFAINVAILFEARTISLSSLDHCLASTCSACAADWKESKGTVGFASLHAPVGLRQDETKLTKMGWFSDGEGKRKSSSASVSGVEGRGEGRSPEENKEED